MSERPIVVFDIGGTHLRWADWSPENGLGEVQRSLSPSLARGVRGTTEELRTMLVAAMAAAMPSGGVAGVSLGAALDHRNSTVYASAPMWGPHSHPYDMAEALRSARPDVQWHIVNDVTAALLHLAASPRGQGRRKIVLATVSTGIACRTIDRRTGEIPLDACGLQGEIGHLPARVTIDGNEVELPCDCGQLGHVSSFSSGPGIRRLGEVIRDRRTRAWEVSVIGGLLAQGESFESALLAALDGGDPVAVELLHTATEPIADVVRTALCLDPEIDLFAFTGGVAVSLGHHYRSAILEHLYRAGIYLTSEREPSWVADRIVVCGPHEAEGLIGAGLAAEPDRSDGCAKQVRP